MGKVRNLVGATLVAGFMSGYLLSDTIDRAVESVAHYQPRSIASVLQLGSPGYRIEGFRSEVQQNPEEMKQYSADFIEIAFTSGMDDRGVETLYGFVRNDLAGNPKKRKQNMVDIARIAAENYPRDTYEQVPEEKRMEYAKDELMEYVKKQGGKLKDNIGEIIALIGVMFD